MVGREHGQHRGEGLPRLLRERDRLLGGRRDRLRQSGEDALTGVLAQRYRLDRRLRHVLGPTEGQGQQGVALARRTRRLAGEGLEEGASTRMLVHAAGLVRRGLEPRAACLQAVVLPLTDEPDLVEALRAAVQASFA